jgi:hypothetical protein
MLTLLVLLSSSFTTMDCGELRSCFDGLQQGLETAWGSNERSSDSMDPEKSAKIIEKLTKNK